MIGYNKFSWVFKDAASKGKWKHKDGSWWTNHNGQIVPYHEPTHGARQEQGHFNGSDGQYNLKTEDGHDFSVRVNSDPEEHRSLTMADKGKKGTIFGVRDKSKQGYGSRPHNYDGDYVIYDDGKNKYRPHYKGVSAEKKKSFTNALRAWHGQTAHLHPKK